LDFDKLTMEFQYQGERQFLEGQRAGVVKWTAGTESKWFSQAIQMFAVHITPTVVEATSLGKVERELRLGKLLQEYADIFTEPKGLPLTETRIIELFSRREHHLSM